MSQLRGTLVLNDEEKREMEEMGASNPSEYVRQKIRSNTASIEAIHTPKHVHMIPDVEKAVELERTKTELEHYKKLLQDSKNKENGLGELLNEKLNQALMERDFQAAKDKNLEYQKIISKLEKELDDLENEFDDKEEKLLKKIEELTEKLSFANVAKELLPGAIAGLSQKFPDHAKLLADKAVSLSGANLQLNGANITEEDRNAMQLGREIIESFPDKDQFEKVCVIVATLGENRHLIDSLYNSLIESLNQ